MNVEKVIKPKPDEMRMKRALAIQPGDVLLLRRGTAPYKKFTQFEVAKVIEIGNYLEIVCKGKTVTVFKNDPMTVLIKK